MLDLTKWRSYSVKCFLTIHVMNEQSERRGEQMMTMLRRFPLFGIFFVLLTLTFTGLQAQTAHAQQARPLGSCGDTVSDDAQLFGSRIVDVVNQAKAMNDSLQADTRVVTVSQDKLAGSSLKAY